MDFFALEAAWIQRLQDKLRLDGKPVDVVSVRELKVDAQNEPVLRVPAVLISFDGYKVPESSLGKARVRQIWTGTVVLANLRDRGRIGARDDGALLIDQLITWTLGWIPPAVEGRAYRALELIDPTSPVAYGTRNAYFPFSFSTERAVKGARES